MNINNLIKICEELSLCAENDAKEFDKKPFKKKYVGKYFANHSSAIKGLCYVLKKLLLEANNE